MKASCKAKRCNLERSDQPDKAGGSAEVIDSLAYITNGDDGKTITPSNRNAYMGRHVGLRH